MWKPSRYSSNSVGRAVIYGMSVFLWNQGLGLGRLYCYYICMSEYLSGHNIRHPSGSNEVFTYPMNATEIRFKLSFLSSSNRQTLASKQVRLRLSTWASYQIRKIAGCACARNAGNVFPRRRFQRKPLVSDPGMHHGTCVTHVPWCMSGSLTCGDGENVPGIPGACAPAILCIWQEAHVILST